MNNPFRASLPFLQYANIYRAWILEISQAQSERQNVTEKSSRHFLSFHFFSTLKKKLTAERGKLSLTRLSRIKQRPKLTFFQPPTLELTKAHFPLMAPS